MTMSPAEIERKVRQLDNDTQAIYELLASISAQQQRQGNRLGELDTRLTALDTNVGHLDTNVTALDTKVDHLDTSITTLDTKLDVLTVSVAARFDAVGQQLASLDTSVAEVLRRLPG